MGIKRRCDICVNSDGETAFDKVVIYDRPYAVREFWEGMKARVSESKIKMALRCAIAARTAPVVKKPTTLFHNLFPKLSKSMTSDIMMQVVSHWSGWDPAKAFDADTDPRILDRESEEYTSFATGVLKAFSSLAEGTARENKPFDFFMSFVNAGRSTPFMRERAMAMMKVLAGDGRYKYGRKLSEAVNPLRLTLETLRYDEERGVVSWRSR